MNVSSWGSSASWMCSVSGFWVSVLTKIFISPFLRRRFGES
jgi:hypothetical protein